MFSIHSLPFPSSFSRSEVEHVQAASRVGTAGGSVGVGRHSTPRGRRARPRKAPWPRREAMGGAAAANAAAATRGPRKTGAVAAEDGVQARALHEEHLQAQPWRRGGRSGLGRRARQVLLRRCGVLRGEAAPHGARRLPRARRGPLLRRRRDHRRCRCRCFRLRCGRKKKTGNKGNR